jgi:4-hydroxy-2-oxoheptanedioate aldolase
MKFPPLGERSWGPTRVLGLLGAPDPQNYLRTANADTLAIAMIETRAAQAALDAILAVDGIDGIFVGPSDFSIALSDGARVEPTNAEMLRAAADIAARTQQAGKIPCTLAITGDAARHFRELGFRLIALGGDLGYLTAGATALLEAARP